MKQVAGARETLELGGAGVVFGSSTPIGMLARLDSEDWLEVGPGAQVRGRFSRLELEFPAVVPDEDLLLFVLGDPSGDLLEPPTPRAWRIANDNLTVAAAAAGTVVVTLPPIAPTSGRPSTLYLRGYADWEGTGTLPWAYLYGSIDGATGLMKGARSTAITNKARAIVPIEDWPYPLAGGFLRMENPGGPSRNLKYDLWTLST